MQASVSFWRAVNQQLVALQEDDAHRAGAPAGGLHFLFRW
jgi:hypothetical protein